MKKLLYILFVLAFISCNTQKKSEETTTQKIEAKELTTVSLASGKLMRIDSFPTKFITPRSVDVWLPDNYNNNKKYAVLYMHDGQMLFDAKTTWNKQEWMMDEVASNLMNENKVQDFIIVAVHNIPAIRWFDLFPEKAINNIPEQTIDSLKSIGNTKFELTDLKGDEYLKFIIKDVKPYIDQTYAVLKDKEHTFIAGSSMGGLMSMYAISEYPDVFQGAACISTHWVGAMPMNDNPFPAAILKYAESNIPNPDNHKLYFDYGNKTLDQFYPEYAPKVDSIYLNGGFNSDNFRNIFFEGTDHSEISWQKRVHIPLTFLLGK